MAKIHQLQKVQKASSNKSNSNTRSARLPVFPRLLNWIKTKIVRHKRYTYDASWNAAFKVFTTLRSIAKGIKKLEVLIVSSTFKAVSAEVDAVVIDYFTWLNIKLQAEQVRGIHSYAFSFELLDSRTIGAVIKGEHAEIFTTVDNLVELRKIDDISKPRRNANLKTVFVEEYFFVYIRDLGLYGMVRAQHQEYLQKKESSELESEVA